MRDAVLKLGGDPDKINPICPSDLVIDHSIQVDFSGTVDALAKNQDLEFERNKERFTFLKWGAKAFNNMLIIPPGSGIVNFFDKGRVFRANRNLFHPAGSSSQLGVLGSRCLR